MAGIEALSPSTSTKGSCDDAVDDLTLKMANMPVEEYEKIRPSTSTKGSCDDAVDDLTLKMANMPVEEYEKIRDQYLEKEIRLVLVGTTGVGKSSTGNTILGKKVFKANPSSKSVAKSCQTAVGERDGHYIKIVDVPGFIDTTFTKEDEQNAIIKCVIEASPGMHAILFVVRIGRFTEQDKRTIERFLACFGKDAMKFVMIIFTGLDDLVDHDMTIENYIIDANPALHDFMTEVQNRYLAVNNKDKESDEFIKKLLKKVSLLVEDNGGQCYTNDVLQEAIEHVKAVEAEKLKQIRIQEEEKRATIVKEYNEVHAAEKKKLEIRIEAEKREKDEIARKLEDTRRMMDRKEEDRRWMMDRQEEETRRMMKLISQRTNNTKHQISHAAMSREAKLGTGLIVGSIGGAASGAATGFATGAIAGPVGAAIGGAAGAVAGFVSGLFM